MVRPLRMGEIVANMNIWFWIKTRVIFVPIKGGEWPPLVLTFVFFYQSKIKIISRYFSTALNYLDGNKTQITIVTFLNIFYIGQEMIWLTKLVPNVS